MQAAKVSAGGARVRGNDDGAWV